MDKAQPHARIINRCAGLRDEDSEYYTVSESGSFDLCHRSKKKMPELHQFVSADFHHFKAFEKFALRIRHFNILVGPNNAGKSTILAAFRILAAALRKANQRKPEVIKGPTGMAYGYSVDLKMIAIAEENIFFNYDDSEAAHVTFKLSNKNELLLYFPEQSTCYLFARTESGKVIQSPATFRAQFNCPIGFVPILGPVEHNEQLYEKEAARLALFNYRAARNFRNIWYHYPEQFDEFRTALRRTWPGMDVEPPRIDTSHQKPRLHMFCPEGRIPREIFWAGFGFQVWCQMLTHLIQSDNAALFLIDEPDIYLHSDLQRQLLGLLRNLGPDVIIATHSTEIITEAEPDDIVLINKRAKQARRIRHPSQLTEVFVALGSNLNPVLTQLAKTKRVVFVEGTDFQIIGRFAAKCGYVGIGNRSDFAVIPSEGFNPERVKILKEGMEFTLGVKIRAAVAFDRDYRCDEEAAKITTACETFCDFATIHRRKEIENFLLVPSAIDRAANRKVADRAKRVGESIKYTDNARIVLDAFAAEKKDDLMGQWLAKRQIFERANSPTLDPATIHVRTLKDFESRWQDDFLRFAMLPGKEALAAINRELQEKYKINVTPTAIVDAMEVGEVIPEMIDLIKGIANFVALPVKA